MRWDEGASPCWAKGTGALMPLPGAEPAASSPRQVMGLWALDILSLLASDGSHFSVRFETSNLQGAVKSCDQTVNVNPKLKWVGRRLRSN